MSPGLYKSSHKTKLIKRSGGGFCAFPVVHSAMFRTDHRMRRLQSISICLCVVIVTERIVTYECLTSRLLQLASALPWATTITSFSTATCRSMRLRQQPPIRLQA